MKWPRNIDNKSLSSINKDRSFTSIARKSYTHPLLTHPFSQTNENKCSTASTAEDVLKPTNPRAVKAVLDGAAYRVTSPPPSASRLKVFPRPIACARDKLPWKLNNKAYIYPNSSDNLHPPQSLVGYISEVTLLLV
ncbi:jg20558 [Pararge aegeria aegeria]|uniref:Jg20558 protein n=1 Tax=Pararge aegeria aegeria TaxID=348720 RepID=A0A8S4QTL2_9NEOP|nr:jg20558 [Pararge aegeria aegeria]